MELRKDKQHSVTCSIQPQARSYVILSLNSIFNMLLRCRHLDYFASHFLHQDLTTLSDTSEDVGVEK